MTRVSTPYYSRYTDDFHYPSSFHGDKTKKSDYGEDGGSEKSIELAMANKDYRKQRGDYDVSSDCAEAPYDSEDSDAYNSEDYEVDTEKISEEDDSEKSSEKDDSEKSSEKEEDADEELSNNAITIIELNIGTDVNDINDILLQVLNMVANAPEFRPDPACKINDGMVTYQFNVDAAADEKTVPPSNSTSSDEQQEAGDTEQEDNSDSDASDEQNASDSEQEDDSDSDEQNTSDSE